MVEVKQQKFRQYRRWYEQPHELAEDYNLTGTEKLLITRLLDLTSMNGGRFTMIKLSHLAGDVGLKSPQHVARLIRSVNAKYDAGTTDWRIYREVHRGHSSMYCVEKVERQRGPRLRIAPVTGHALKPPRRNGQQLELFADPAPMRAAIRPPPPPQPPAPQPTPRIEQGMRLQPQNSTPLASPPTRFEEVRPVAPLPPDPAAGTLFARRERYNPFVDATAVGLAKALALAVDDRRCRRVRLDGRMRYILHCITPAAGGVELILGNERDARRPDRVVVQPTQIGRLELYT